MADYSHTGGSAFTNENKLPDSVKKNAVTATSVKTLDTGHDETSLKAQMTSEMNALMNTNGSLLEKLLGSLIGGAIETVGKLLKGAWDLGSTIVGGIIDVGSAIIGGAIDAVGGFFGWMGSTLVSLLPGNRTPKVPPPPIYSEIATNLEEEIEPFVQAFDQAQLSIDGLFTLNEELREEYGEQLETNRINIEDAQRILEEVGDVNQKIADAAGQVLTVADAAREKADQVNNDLILYKQTNDPLVRAARDDAAKALSDYDSLSSDLSTVESNASDALDKLSGLTESVLGNRVNNAVTGSVSEYAVASSETVPPTTGWSESVPTRVPGTFIWARTTITYGSGTSSVSDPVLVTGNTGTKGDAGADGADGVGISGATIHYTSSTSGTTTPTSGWVTTIPSVSAGQFLWTRTVTEFTDETTATTYSVARQGANGANGAAGAKGEDGLTSYFHTAYATNATGTTGFSTTDANGKTYVGTYSDFTEADSTDPAKYTWQLVKGADGANGKGVQSAVVTYASSTSGTSTPSTGWATTIPTVAQGSYLWTRTVTTFTDGATTTAYSSARQGANGATGAKGDKGDTGAQGPQGVQGAAGKDGQPTYTWIKYADSATGTGISNSPDGKTYIGFAYNKNTATESSVASDYTWSLIKGDKGDQGVQGAKGTNGTTTYTWIKYSNSANGASPYDTPTAATQYIGIAVNKTTATESNTPGDYTWSKFRGDDGATGDTGAQGVSVTSIDTYYRLVTRGAAKPAKPTVATPSTAEWSLTEPAFEANRELYRTDKVTYSNSTFAWTDVSKVSAYTASTEAMNTAVDALAGVFNSTDIGSSLVAYIPGTSTPVWADTMTPATPEENPQGLPEAYVFSSMSNTLPMPNSVSVNPGIDYRVSVWIKADKPDSKMYYELRDQDGTHAVQSGSIGGGGTYLINNLTLPTEWTLYETVLTFRPSVKRIYLARRYANHSNGTERNAVQYMADLRINPVTVTPADVTNTVKVVADSLNSYRTANDKAVSDANKAATDAAGLAGSKGEVIYQSSAPTGARATKANLWIRTSDNTPHTYDGSKWVAVTDKVATDAAKAASDANNLAKSKTTTYYQTTAPAASVSVVGDLWIDQSTAGKNTLKRWSGSAWVTVQDKAIVEAMAAAGTAQSTADGKVRTFAQTSAPTGVTSKDTGDLWIDTDDGNKLYRWSGSAWLSLQDKGIVSALNLAEKGVGDAKTINDTMNAAFASGEEYSGSLQLKWNKLVNNVDDSQNIAIQGLTASTMLAFPHMNVAPNDSSGRPWWSIGMSVNSGFTPPGFPSGKSYWTASSSISNVNPEALITVVPGIDYKLEFWTARVDAETAGAFVDLRDESGRVVLTHWADVTGGVPTEISWNARNYAGDSLSSHEQWERKVYLLRVQPGTNKMALHFRPRSTATTNSTRVRFWGAHLSAFMPIQEKLDSAQTGAILANAKLDDAQTGLIAANNRVISAHQRIINLLYPNMTLVPMMEDGITPVWTTQCEKTVDGGWIPPMDVPNGVTGVALGQSTPHVSVDTSLTYRAVIKFRHHHPDPTATTYVAAVFAKSSSPGNQPLATPVNDTPFPPDTERQPITGFASKVIPAGQWTTWMGDFKFSHTFTEKIRIGGIAAYTYKDVSDVQSAEIASLEIYPLLPSQTDVNAAHSEAIQANTKAIRLAFPDLNLDPQTTAGHPQWSNASTVTVQTAPILGLSPTYKVAGSTSNSGGLIDFEKDISEYRIRGKITPGTSATSFTINILSTAGTSVVDGWRLTFPESNSEEELYSGEVTWTTGHAVLDVTKGLIGTPGEWADFDIVVKLKPGTTTGRLSVASSTLANQWVNIYGLRVSSFSPSQWQVDFAQNRALDGLQRSLEIQDGINTNNADIDKKLNMQLGALRDIQKKSAEIISRIMMCTTFGTNTAAELDDYIQIRKPGSSKGQYAVDARGVKWLGAMVISYIYQDGTPGSRIEKIVAGGGRTFLVPGYSGNVNNPLAYLRVDYQVNAKSQILDVKPNPANTSSQIMPLGEASRSVMTFTATASGQHIVDMTIGWEYTTRQSKYYGIQIRKGTTTKLAELKQSNIGPQFSFQDGYREQHLTWAGDLAVGDTLTFWTNTGVNPGGNNPPTDKQRRIRYEQRKVSWLTTQTA